MFVPLMMRIINRLTAATVTVDVRADMLVEDEFFSAIENRDTALRIRDKKREILLFLDKVVSLPMDKLCSVSLNKQYIMRP